MGILTANLPAFIKCVCNHSVISVLFKLGFFAFGSLRKWLGQHVNKETCLFIEKQIFKSDLKTNFPSFLRVVLEDVD